jgi:TolB-like protein
MPIWSAEIKELENLYSSVKGRFPELEKELERLIKADDENMVLLYSRRCLEVIITDLCESELKRPRKTEPLKGIIDKLNREDKVPSHIIASMHSLNSLSTFGAHPKEFDPEQVKPVINNLNTIIKWYLKYNNIRFDKEKEIKIDEPSSDVKSKDYLTSDSFARKEKSIIVLPFENISPDPDQEYFSDGLTEEIITDLSHIHDLLVISRSSAMTFKGTKSTIKEITEKVNVQYVLEGSVRKAGNNLRITAQLIDGMTDSHLWAEKYSGTLDDIFDIQEKVSRSIVEALRLKLSSKETKSIAKRPIENIEAYDYYLKGQSAILTFTEDGLHKARQYYEAALKITGDNAFLYAALGNVYIEYAHIWINQEDSLNEAEEYARKALELDPDTAQAYLILACCQLYRGIITKNEVNLLKKGYSIDPNDIVLTHYYGWSYIIVGRPSKALPLANRIIELDPFSFMCAFLGVVLFYMGKFMEAAEIGKKFGLPASLDLPVSRFYYAFFLAFAGKKDEALDVLEPVERISTSDFFLQNARLLKYALEGKKEKINELMTEEFILAEKREGVESCWAASFFAILGDFDTALDWLENAVDRSFINYPYMSQYDPFLTKMRGIPRYDKLMERVKHEWENFEV